MLGLDYHPRIVGREGELEVFKTYLERAIEGQGNTLLISGEAGIGKTRLLNELKALAKSRGFKVLSGNSLYESLIPYMPFMEALRSGGLESLFAEESPRVEGVYLVTDTGLLIKDVLREETCLDSDLFASMLASVSNFVSDSLSMLTGEEKEGMLNTLGYENFRILVQGGTKTNLVVIMIGKENEFLLNDMRKILSDVHEYYGNVLAKWDGDKEKVTGIESILRPLMTSGKHDGIYYGLDDPKARRNLLFENISLGLIRHAKTTPTLVCIEDLHWADPSSLALMHYVARNTRKCKLLVVGTYRPEDVTPRGGVPHPLVETMRLMGREDLYQKMELRRLPEGSLLEFLTALFGEFEFGDEFRALIYRETEGNPLFIIELLRLLVHEGVIKPYDGTWRLSRSLGKVNIPSKIHDVILRRLDRLDNEDRKVLEYASVMGEVFTSMVLADALSLERIRLLERLRVLEKTHRLIHPCDGSYKFDHAKIKEVLYDDIPLELRVEYHAAIADTIEKLNKDNVDETVGDLAFHYYHCRNREKALLYLVKAAEKAKKEYSNEEAIRFYTEALEFEQDAQKRGGIFENLGDIHDLTGHYDKAIESYNDALELAEDRRKKAEIKARIGGICERKGEYDKSLEVCIEALSLVKGEECREEALALSNIGVAHEVRGDYDKALECYRRSLEIREKIGDQRGVAISLNNIGNVHEIRGDYDKALECGEMCLKIFEKISDQRGVAISLNNIGNVYYHREDYDKALECHEKSLKIRENIGDQQGVAESLGNISNVHMDRGDYDKALECGEMCLGIFEKIGSQWDIAATFTNIGNVHFRRGDYDKALKYCEMGLARFEELGHQYGVAAALNIIGNVYFRRGDHDKALEYHEKSLGIREGIDDHPGVIDSLCDLAETYLKKRDSKAAEDICGRAYEMAGRLAAKNHMAKASKVFGEIYSEQHRWTESIASYQESIRVFEEIGMKMELGDSYCQFGLMWKAKGDVEEAKTYLEKAIRVFEKLKLDKRVDEVRAALDTLQT